MEDRIFLVLIPEYPTAQIARLLQEEVNRKYQLYTVLPTLHITLDSFFSKGGAENARAVEAIGQICAEIDPFPIIVKGFACFGPPFKSVQLHVEQTSPLVSLYKKVHTRLKELDFRVREYPEGVKLHMTIASTCFAEREWSYEEYTVACQELRSLPLESGFMLQRLELWYPEIDPAERLLASFTI